MAPDSEWTTLDPEGEARGEHGDRLDRFLAHVLGVSRAAVRRLLGEGAVRVDGRGVGPEAKGRPVAPADSVQVVAGRRAETDAPLPEPEAALHVLAEGPTAIAIDKPAGQPVHPYRADERGTALNALVARAPEIVGVGEGGLRSGVVHRLDVDTSGVLLFATREEAWRRAREAFASGSARKRYRALVAGHLEGEGAGRFDLYVARHRPAQVRVAGPATREKTWPTRLAWRSLEVFRDATLVEVTPRTGFLHQIRVCLSELGHPVLGDAIYGGVEGAFAARTGLHPGRHLLHAAGLAIDALEVEAESPDPRDFVEALRVLRDA